MSSAQINASAPGADDDTVELAQLLGALAASWKSGIVAAVVAGAAGFGLACLIPPVYTARALIIPPQQQGSAAASALNSLGALAGLAGGGVKSPADEYVSLMKSVTVEDRIIDRFKLLAVYDEKTFADTRRRLEKNVAITVGAKDGLIAIEVDDVDPRRAADIAGAFVDGLRSMTDMLAVTEAQQRRRFFEARLRETQEQLTQAQRALEATGVDAGATKIGSTAAVEGYAQLRAEAISAQVRLETLRSRLTDGSPQVLQQRAKVDALQAELRPRESASTRVEGDGAPNYVARQREFVYQTTLFRLLAQQYETARIDESREGAPTQVVDQAMPPERPSKPKRPLIALGAALAGLFASGLRAIARLARTN